MSPEYDITSFDLDYCQQDVAIIADAIKSKGSLLAIGMPACGKSRLSDFLINRPGVLNRYGVSNDVKIIRVDGDIVGDDPQIIYTELLSALNVDIKNFASEKPNILKNQLLYTVKQLEPERDLVVIFDNFNRSLQEALGEDFFKFLFGLRNDRPKLNISYIFMANLNIDFEAFHKVDRLFDRGVDHSICWLSLLNQKDTYFSILRQWHKAGRGTNDEFEVEQEMLKKQIYKLSGGHALMARYLSHLMMSGEISPDTNLHKILEHHGIYTACEAIWDDLQQSHKNWLINFATDNAFSMLTDMSIQELMTNYGILKDQTFFSPLFEYFVKQQEKMSQLIEIDCNQLMTKVIVKTTTDERTFPLEHHSSKRGGLLSPTARGLLCYLLKNQNEVCLRDQLIKVGWPSDEQEGVSYKAVDGHISRIKSWLNEHKDLKKYLHIETVYGTGYKLLITKD